MEDVEIRLRVQKECELARDSERNPNADPSLYAPWGIMSYPKDYKRVACERLD